MGTSCRDWPRLEEKVVGRGRKKWGGGKKEGNEVVADERR